MCIAAEKKKKKKVFPRPTLVSQHSPTAMTIFALTLTIKCFYCYLDGCGGV